MVPATGEAEVERSAWIWEAEVVVSGDCATILQSLGDKVRLHLRKQKQKKLTLACCNSRNLFSMARCSDSRA